MVKKYWIGPPEHAKVDDQVDLWLESGDLLEPKTYSKPGVKGADEVPYLLIGFDTEFKTPDHAVSTEEVREGVAKSLILSYQFYAKCSDGRIWKGICCPEGDERLTLQEFMLFVLGSGARIEGFRDIPTKVYLVGHFTRADIPAFADFSDITKVISAVRNTFISLDQTLKICVPLGDTEVEVNAYLRDTMLLTPQSSKSLKKLGDLVGVKKIELSPDRSAYREMIRNMDRVRTEQWDLFKEYALTDAEICVHYIGRVMDEYRSVTGESKVPVTLTGIGMDLIDKFWKQSGFDRLKVLGKELISIKQFSKRKGYYYKTTQEIDLPLVHYYTALATDCYHGGRNEQYWFGPCFEDDWSDYDLSSAYPTAMALIGMPNWNQVKNSRRVDDYTPTTLGYAVVEFEFPRSVRFPTLPVRTNNGLVFPRKGTTECPAPEIYLARQLGAKLTIKHGVIFESDPDKLVFTGFIKDCIEKRKIAGKNTLQGLFWKEISNSTYGKTAQGLRVRRVYDLREQTTKVLPPSRITNAYFAAFITSFVRAVLGEIMNKVPDHRVVFSCTTDGFLTNVTDAELDDCTSGFLCQLYREKRELLTGESSVLEKKHYVRNPLGWRTRGQATLVQGNPVSVEDKHIVLAKGGIWIPPEYEEVEDQNSEIINYFMDRTPGTTIEIEGKTGIRDMVEHDADFVEKLVTKRLNMEFDWKRRPFGYKDSIKFGHLAFSTSPWDSVEQFVEMRNVFEEFQKGSPRCIKSVDDLLMLSNFVETKTVASSADLKYVHKKDGDVKQLRKMLCSAFKHRRAGFRLLASTNLEFAELLQACGIPTTKAHVENGLKKPYLPHQVPPTERVLELLMVLKAACPQMDEEDLLIDSSASESTIRLVNEVNCPFINQVI